MEQGDILRIFYKSLNPTIVECKRITMLVIVEVIESLNPTIVECKREFNSLLVSIIAS